MQTVRRMNNVHRIIREKPSIEAPRHRCDKARSKFFSLFFFQRLMEGGKRLEESIEIIPGKIIEKHLETRWFLVQVLAGGFNGVQNVGRHHQRVGSGGAAHVCYSYTLRIDCTINCYNTLFQCWPRSGNHFAL